MTAKTTTTPAATAATTLDTLLFHLSMLKDDIGEGADMIAMVGIFDILSEISCEPSWKASFASNGGIPAIVNAAKRPHNNCGPFFDRAFGIFFYLFPNRERDQNAPPDRRMAGAIIKEGALGCVMQGMRSRCRDDAFLAYTSVGIINELFENGLGSRETRELARVVLLKTQTLMELHIDDVEDPNSSCLFYYCCSVLGHCHRTGYPIEGDCLERITQCIGKGIVAHEDDQLAVNLGREVLFDLVGRENGIRVIDLAERKQCETTGVSCAA